MMPAHPDRQLSLHDVADRLGVHYMTVYRYVRTGRLPAVHDGRVWKVSERDLAAWSDKPRRGRPPSGEGPDGRRPARRRLTDRMLAGDEPGAWQVIEDSLAQGATPSDVYVEMLVPALHDIGLAWSRDEVTVADEHRATAVAQRLVGRLGPLMRRPGGRRGSVVLGAAPGDRHSLPTAIAGDLLRAEGYVVLDFGADVPADSFREGIEGAPRLRAVVVSVATQLDRDVLADLGARIRESAAGVPVLVGGPASGPEVASALGPGVVHVATLAELAATVRSSASSGSPA